MKKIILVMLISLVGITTQGQEKKSKSKKVEFVVGGNCEMCQKRIEKAAFSVKGVKSANWHIDHKDIHLIIDETKCSAEDVQKAIALAGHDTDKLKTSDKLYEKLHGCCQYARL
jgi:copper chaperone CopZ